MVKYMMDMHVLVFVTEDFSASDQVKMDYPEKNSADAVKILKLNMTKKFNTGIYPYSMMLSVFSPLEDHLDGRAIKVASSSQEWCGHTYTQLNNKGTSFAVQSNSYFQQEGNVQFSIGKAWLEDELWSRIRIDPRSLPLGEIDIIPGTLSARLRHSPLAIQKANASMVKLGKTSTFELLYDNDKRVLSITFENKFPHAILKWEETYVSGWGKSAKKLTTTAIRNKTVQSDYWNKNSNADLHLRKSLGLD